MPLPIALLAASAAAPMIGAGISRLVGGKKKIPDLLNPAVNEAQQSAADLQAQQDRQFAMAEERAARSGLGTQGYVEDLVNANARQDALLRASILDTIANARKEQELVETQAKNEERAQLMAGIQQGFNNIGSGLGALAGMPPGASAAASVAGGTSQVVGSSPIQLTSAAPAAIPSANPAFDPNGIQSVQPAGFETLPVQAQLPNQLVWIPSAADLAQRSFNNMQG